MTTNPVTSVTEPQGDQANANQRQRVDPTPANQERTNTPAPSNPQTTNTERVATPVATRDSDVVTPEVTAPSNPAWLSVENAEDNLLELMFRFDEPNPNYAAIRDTATAYFNATGISDKDKALAAFVTAQAIFDGTQDRLRARDWAQQAVQLDGSNRSYRNLLTELGGGSS